MNQRAYTDLDSSHSCISSHQEMHICNSTLPMNLNDIKPLSQAPCLAYIYFLIGEIPSKVGRVCNNKCHYCVIHAVYCIIHAVVDHLL